MPLRIQIIRPYWDGDAWIVDDPVHGLHGEPFVSGIPKMIDSLVSAVPNADKGFRLLLSPEPFPGYQIELVQVKNKGKQPQYRWSERGAKGRLCPALLKAYFPVAPPTLYLRAEPDA